MNGYIAAPEMNRSGNASGDTMDTNRFTIADYAYDRDEEVDVGGDGRAGGGAGAESSTGLVRQVHGQGQGSEWLSSPGDGGLATGRPMSGRPTSWGMALRNQLNDVDHTDTMRHDLPSSSGGVDVASQNKGLMPSPTLHSASRAYQTLASAAPPAQQMGRLAEDQSRNSPDIVSPTTSRSLHSYPPTSPPTDTLLSPTSIRRLPCVPQPTPSPPPLGSGPTEVRPLPFLPSASASGSGGLPGRSLSTSTSLASATGSGVGSSLSPRYAFSPEAGPSRSPIGRSPTTPGGTCGPSFPPTASSLEPASRPSLPSMPSTSTELPTLPSLGRSYRGSGVSYDDARSGNGGGPGGDDEEFGRYGEGSGAARHHHHVPGDDELGYGEKRDSKTTAFIEPKVPKADTSWRRFFPKSVYCRLLLFTVVFELVVDLTIESNILYRFNAEVNSTNSTDIMLENKRRLPIFLIIFGLAHLWQLVLTIISIRTKNTIQVTAVTLFNFAFLAWAVIQVNELRDILGSLNQALELDGTRGTLVTIPLNVLTGIIIGVVSLGCVVLSVLTVYIRREFGWQRYRFLGADLQIRACYRRFQVFECVCYFSAFFCFGFGVQFIWLVLQPTDIEYIITWIAFPLSLILLVIGRTAAKYENKPFMIFFAFGLVLAEAYFVFKLVRIWQASSTVYANVSKSLTVFAVLSILALGSLVVGTVLVWRDFGKGLKGAVLAMEYGKGWKMRLRRFFGGKNGSGTGDGAGQIGSGVEGGGREKEMSLVQQKRLSID